jgi:D-sedoheptulose 7-phosphate isomerase
MNKFISNINAALHNLNTLNSNNLEYLKKIILENNSEIILLGNGGSNAISAHMAEDYTKALKKRGIAFTDGARLTCYANDYGYEHIFSQYLSEFSTQNSLVILISSSGNSKNILNSALYCKNNNINYIILSGFESNNQLRTLFKDNALIDFWVDSTDYGVVECVHEIILHSVI